MKVSLDQLSTIEVLAFFGMHWGEYYSVFSPTEYRERPVPGEHWFAVARFGSHDELKADSPDGLRLAIHEHWQQHKNLGQ